MKNYTKIDDEKLSKLHLVQLEILDEVVRVCEKNNISYQLAGGTLLGAVRHKGFIPWDDDIDLTMVRDDYDKFIEVAKKDLDGKYYLQCYETEDCYFPFVKIRKKGTVFDEKELTHLDCEKGIFIDIFPLEKINNPNSVVLNIKAILIKNIWDTIFVKKGIYRSYKETKHPIFCFCLSLFPYKILKNFQIWLMKSSNKKDSKYLCALCGAYHYKKDIHKYSEMMPTSKIKFEGKEYTTFKNPDYYLSNLYGNYMKLPPKDKRVNHAPEHIIFNIDEKNN